jgi:hypothetical protein
MSSEGDTVAMSQSKKVPETEPQTEFVLLYSQLEQPEAKATIVAVEEMSESTSAVAEVARLARDSWPPFMTFFSA